MVDVKFIREVLGLTQKELAEKIGVSRNTIVNYENDKVIPASKCQILVSLLELSALNIDIDTIAIKDGYVVAKEKGTNNFVKGKFVPSYNNAQNKGNINTGAVGGDNLNNSRGVYNKGSISGNIITGDNSTPKYDKDQTILILENEVKHLNELLAEKERFIQALLKK